ncbi:hypothetical protein [Cohnella luojiensis]|uniref:Uncharacterized protein n=1 Tax=Cohnella luojiensis TaxID=652876 RepID=A0A4Y8M6F1_9BACL|nr:hypothetical protein [Cohnella luojiensis]TFE30844.1 hypothetical protein E2980_03445 [Cohnella luojiensis]
MEILGRKISGKTERIINEIYSNLKKPVEFRSIEAGNAFGSIIDNTDTFIVHLSLRLNGDVFETNLLHELFHGIQMTNSYPEIGNIVNDQFVAMLCSSLSSLVLDLEVQERLTEHGYDSSYFFNYRNRVLKELANKNFAPIINDELNQKYVSTNLALFFLTASETQSKFIKHLYQNAPINTLNGALKIVDAIKKIGYDSPAKCFNCFMGVLDTLDIWNFYGILYNGKSYSRLKSS